MILVIFFTKFKFRGVPPAAKKLFCAALTGFRAQGKIGFLPFLLGFWIESFEQIMGKSWSAMRPNDQFGLDALVQVICKF